MLDYISTTYCSPEVLYGVRCNSSRHNFVLNNFFTPD